MKIFAFRLGVSFDIEGRYGNFRMETAPLADIEAYLSEHGPDFPGQVFYAPAENDPDFADRVFAFHTHEPLHEKSAEVIILFPNPETRENFLSSYLERFKKQEAAGGLVLNPENELLLIERHGLWDLPKGKLEKGEKKKEGAWREVMEECGIQGHVVKKKLETTYHIFLRRDKWRIKPTYWYWMETESKEKLTPQGEEAITQAIWVPMDQIRQEIPETYPTIEAVIRDLIYKSAGSLPQEPAH